jgi:pyruvate,water dikinase
VAFAAELATISRISARVLAARMAGYAGSVNASSIPHDLVVLAQPSKNCLVDALPNASFRRFLKPAPTRHATAAAEFATAGFCVPDAFVLTTAFFEPWLERVHNMPAWQALLQAAQRDWPSYCADLQVELLSLDWTPEQLTARDQLGCHSAIDGTATRFALRSSSSDEDQETASFAGLYRSCLGVFGTELAQAIRSCFAACLDAPVLTYKAAQGLPVFEPTIAVIIQQQIDSEISGVGFSIHPVTNDNDELLINASWG